MAASSLGNAPRFLMIFRKDRFTDSTVLVVYMIFRISAGKGKKRNDMLPVPRFPHRADCEVLFTPLLREPIQLLLGGFPRLGLRILPSSRARPPFGLWSSHSSSCAASNGQCRAVLEPSGRCSRWGFGKSFQTIDASDKYIQ